MLKFKLHWFEGCLFTLITGASASAGSGRSSILVVASDDQWAGIVLFNFLKDFTMVNKSQFQMLIFMLIVISME